MDASVFQIGSFPKTLHVGSREIAPDGRLVQHIETIAYYQLFLWPYEGSTPLQPPAVPPNVYRTNVWGIETCHVNIPYRVKRGQDGKSCYQILDIRRTGENIGIVAGLGPCNSTGTMQGSEVGPHFTFRPIRWTPIPGADNNTSTATSFKEGRQFQWSIWSREVEGAPARHQYFDRLWSIFSIEALQENWQAA
jgi:hypothetical protein